jgi:ABC-type multidrug transport system ATPase subunit
MHTGQAETKSDIQSRDFFSVRSLNKQFGRRRVLSGVSFSVRQSEILGLIGPNGAGKTTLFECLAGLEPCQISKLTHNENELSWFKRNRALFYLPDAITPWPDQSVVWVLSFFPKLYSQSDERVSELAEKLRLDGLKKSRIGSLSKGERKRLLLALGLLTTQPLLLLDEPFDGLDLRQTRDAMELLRAEATSGRTLMLSIHQLVDAARICDRLVLLSDGRTVGEGTLEELRAQANLSEGNLEDIFLALT